MGAAAGLSITDLSILVFAALVAGTVRGFSGFGTALVYLPIAGIVLDPVAAVLTVVLMDVFGPLPILPRVARDIRRGDLARLLLGAALALPLGLAALFVIDPGLFRLLVSVLSLTMLALLVGGWRYTGQLGPGATFGTGLASGFLGGVAGLPGPPVIFALMASPFPARTVRANLTAFLFGYDFLVLAMLLLAGRLAPEPALVGLALGVPNMVGNMIGGKLFVPGHERSYRMAAYLLIFAAAVLGLPIWNGEG
ncbi:sulfite exporter TauE/SafE family protein [Pukyongiella litopenaei]|uniref:Probable membrane transporter protein n=1 Tax=Pukyongiella litopenaei TaxID=2605946 RepID=A0A2S0MV57_9RHOB|nr:sulfite exporter TauE/SafE family protein [Pukyongiella litopenaei]